MFFLASPLGDAFSKALNNTESGFHE